MSNPPRKKGSAFERLVVDWLNEVLPVTVERRALEGTKDRGDVSGIPEVCIEIKNHKTLALGPWLNEAEREADRDGGSLPIVFHKRKGQGHPASNFVTMPGWAFVDLLKVWLSSIHPEQLRALVRLLGNQELTPTAQRQLLSLVGGDA